MASVPWNTRTLIGSQTVGSYQHSGSDYTFSVYATAARSGKVATVFFEYYLALNNGYAGWDGYTSNTPYYTFSVNGTQEKSGSLSSKMSSGNLCTLSKTFTAGDDGRFASISVSAVWHDIGYGWVAKSNTISGSVNLAEIPTYTVQFSSNGGSGTISNMTKLDGVDLTLPSSGYTKTGYHQTSWRLNSTSGQAYALGGTYSSNSSATFVADWTVNTYQVKFNANGGSGTMSNQVFTYGVAQNLTSNAFTRSGYRFAGWATSANGDVVYTDGESVSNLTSTDGAVVNLYAVWIKSGIHVKDNGTWKDGQVFVKVNGEWKTGVVYAKNNGSWGQGS